MLAKVAEFVHIWSHWVVVLYGLVTISLHGDTGGFGLDRRRINLIAMQIKKKENHV